MRPGPVVVINPNSNRAVTSGLDEALRGFRFPGGPEIECLTLAGGPFGIETRDQSDQVVAPLVRLAGSRPDASAFIIACYSDPGLDACRAAVSAPVFGIQESGLLTAMARGGMVGVIAISAGSIERHGEYIMRLGIEERVAAERSLDMSVDETARGDNTFERLTGAGNLLTGDGADVIVLGCAGMARHREPLEKALGVPVIDPTQAAVAMALGAVLTAG